MQQPTNGSPPQRPRKPSPHGVLSQLRLTEQPQEKREVDQFMLLSVSDRCELLYRMLNRVASVVEQHAQQFPLIDLACREMADAIHELQPKEPHNDRTHPFPRH